MLRYLAVLVVMSVALVAAPAVAQVDLIAVGFGQGDDNGGTGVYRQQGGALTRNYKMTGAGGNVTSVDWFTDASGFAYVTDAASGAFASVDPNGGWIAPPNGLGSPGLDVTVLSQSNDKVVMSLQGASAQTRNKALNGIVHGPAMMGAGVITSTELPNGNVIYLYEDPNSPRTRIRSAPGGDWNQQQDIFDNGFGAGDRAVVLSSLPNGRGIIGSDDNGRISVRPNDGVCCHDNGNMRGPGIGVTDVLGLPDGNMAVAFSNGDFNIYTGAAPFNSLGGGGGWHVTSMDVNPVTNNLVYGTASGDVWVRDLDGYTPGGQYPLATIAHQNVSNSPIGSISVANAVPEPASAVMLLIASLGAVCLRRRK